MKIPALIFAAASACALLAANTPIAHAQTKPMAPPVAGAKPPAHRPNMVDAMTKSLGLSPAQVTQIKAIMKTRSDKRKGIDDALLTAKGRRDQQKAVDDATRTQVAAVLTPAQQMKYLQMEAARKAARANAPKKP